MRKFFHRKVNQAGLCSFADVESQIGKENCDVVLRRACEKLKNYLGDRKDSFDEMEFSAAIMQVEFELLSFLGSSLPYLKGKSHSGIHLNSFFINFNEPKFGIERRESTVALEKQMLKEEPLPALQRLIDSSLKENVSASVRH